MWNLHVTDLVSNEKAVQNQTKNVISKELQTDLLFPKFL
jgi:hypothetical protein